MRDPAEGLLPAVTDSPERTRELGMRLASSLRPGDVLALYGGLGAGKTELVKGICAGLGVGEHEVNSPTYTIVNEYRSGSVAVFHFDAYRIRGVDEFFDLGYEEYFFDDGVTVVEWAEKVEPLMPENAFRLKLEHVSAERRRISKL